MRQNSQHKPNQWDRLHRNGCHHNDITHVTYAICHNTSALGHTSMVFIKATNLLKNIIAYS